MKQTLVVSLFLGILVCGTHVGAAEKIVVEKSPFAEAHFMIVGPGFAGGMGWDIHAATIWGREEAEYRRVPSSNVQVDFSKIVKEPDNDVRTWREISVLWKNIQFTIDRAQKGMSISYVRERNRHDELDNVTVTVPSERDKLLWIIRAERFYAAYLAAFWEKKYDMEISRKTETEPSKILQPEILLHDPIMVFPKD